jgi:hypothetical protein
MTAEFISPPPSSVLAECSLHVRKYIPLTFLPQSIVAVDGGWHGRRHAGILKHARFRRILSTIYPEKILKKTLETLLCLVYNSNEVPFWDDVIRAVYSYQV